MREPDTGTLTRILLQTAPGGEEHYRRTCLEPLGELTFSGYYEAVLEEKGVSRSRALADSGLEIHYGYQILRGLKHPSRDKLLCLCIGGGLTLEETARALERAQLGALYPKRLRDALIMLALNRGLRPVWRVNELLAEHGQPLLG